MQAVFLDFDGVIADSIRETYVISLQAYYGVKGPSDEESVGALFFKYRGLVRPPHHFLALHKTIEFCLDKGKDPGMAIFRNVFEKYIEQCEPQKNKFEALFFGLRTRYQLSSEYWVSLNPITEYGKSLVGKELARYFILTTKDAKAVDVLLKAYGIDIEKRFTKSDYERFNNKGAIIQYVLDTYPEYDSAVFVDDAVEHLDSVTNSNVSCLFAEWGYGENNVYPPFTPDMWNSI